MKRQSTGTEVELATEDSGGGGGGTVDQGTGGLSPWLVTGSVDVSTLPSLPAGTNNIGDVDVLSLPALPAGTNNIGDVDVLSLPALAAGTDTIGAVKNDGYKNAMWFESHFPAANTQATKTKSALGASIKIVVTGFTVTICSSSTTAPAAIQLDVKLVSDPAGTPETLWGTVISLPAQAGAITSFTRSGRWVQGVANKDVRLQFSAAGGANTIQSVSMEGTSE